VLIADDEPMVLEIMQFLLERAGCRVMTSCDGLAAVETFRANPAAIGCVILDLSMPKLCGVEAAQRIRAIHGTVPIILASGSDKHESALGVDRVISGRIVKPFRLDQVLSVIKAVTGRDDLA